MPHRATRRFWDAYAQLPESIQDLADRNFELLKENPRHSSLNFKRVGDFWSARVGRNYRAIAIDVEDGFLWIWIGTHTEYDRFIDRR